MTNTDDAIRENEDIIYASVKYINWVFFRIHKQKYYTTVEILGYDMSFVCQKFVFYFYVRQLLSCKELLSSQHVCFILNPLTLGQ